MPFTESIAGAEDIIARSSKKRRRGKPGAVVLFENQPASLAQSRLMIFFSAAYFAAEARIIGLMICWSAA
jgi:hypothetical protein